MDRLILYLGGVALLLALASIPLWLHTSERDEVPANPAPGSSPEPPELGGTFQRGVVLGVFPHGNERPRYVEDFREIRALGANTVSLNFNWFMDSVYDEGVYRGRADRNNQTPHDDILKQAINDAHAEGLRVMMFPSIYLLNLGEGQWRGTIRPPDWSAWFASYRSQMVELARMCEAFGVESLCIGIELISSERFTEEWLRIIEAVRAVYSGEILYSANWDARRRNPWFRELDQIAMNAYYTLSRSTSPSKAELVERWRRIRREIAEWREWVGRPLIISEIGYRSTEGTLAAPWNYFMHGDVDLEVQRLAYDAFFRAWYEDELLEGVYFYKWFGSGGPNDTSYTPRGKPAARTLQRWFGRIAEREAQQARKTETNEAHRDERSPAEASHAETDAAQEREAAPGYRGQSPPFPSTQAAQEDAPLPGGVRPLKVRHEPEPAVRFHEAPQRWRKVGDVIEPATGESRYYVEKIDPGLGSVTLRNLEHGDIHYLFAPVAD